MEEDSGGNGKEKFEFVCFVGLSFTFIGIIIRTEIQILHILQVNQRSEID